MFKRAQWRQLRARFPSKRYNIDEYSHILEPLTSICGICDKKKNFDTNWLNLYKALKKLNNYDPNIQPEHNDINFCVNLLLHNLSTITDQPHLFNNEIDISEWDYVVKFWGVVTERLFHGTGLRLKWGVTCLMR